MFLVTITLPAAANIMQQNRLQQTTGSCTIFFAPENRGVIKTLSPVCTKQIITIYRQLGTAPPDTTRNDNIKIGIAQTPESFKSMAPAGAAIPHWSGALAFPQHNTVLLALNNRHGNPVTDLPVILAHELSHMGTGRPQTVHRHHAGLPKVWLFCNPKELR
jgi:hypothetical protein